jgi:hypothetical protein
MAVVMAVTMVPPVTVVVILTVPMSLVHLPAFPVVVVMRMSPVCPFKRRMVPASPDPSVMVTLRLPIPFDPDEAWAWNRSRFLIADRRWRRPDVHRNLGGTRHNDSDYEQRAIRPIRFDCVSP